MTTAARPFILLTATCRSSSDSTRGCLISTNSWSGNCASSACTRRAAVSPVASETTWSSTGGLGIAGSVASPLTSGRGGDDRARDDGQDRVALPAARLRLPLLRDLRRPRLDVRLRPLRRSGQEQHPLPLVPGDGAGTRRHRGSRLRGDPEPARVGG